MCNLHINWEKVHNHPASELISTTTKEDDNSMVHTTEINQRIEK
jgi:hypothetical protein